MDGYMRLSEEFGALDRSDRFCGDKLESMAVNFIKKHQKSLQKVEFTVDSRLKTNPECKSYDIIREDQMIASLSVDEVESKVSRDARILADVYRMACLGCYFRVTFNKARKNQDDDKTEAVQWARLAIRYNPNDFGACYWFMASLSWQMEHMPNSKHKLELSAVHQKMCFRCIELKPEDGLAYHLLGCYCYFVAGLSWTERFLAHKVMRRKLEATYDDAELYLKKSNKIADWIPNCLWLARTALAQQKPMEEVKKWVDLGLSLKCNEPISEIDRETLLEMRAKLKLSD